MKFISTPYYVIKGWFSYLLSPSGWFDQELTDDERSVTPDILPTGRGRGSAHGRRIFGDVVQYTQRIFGFGTASVCLDGINSGRTWFVTRGQGQAQMSIGTRAQGQYTPGPILGHGMIETIKMSVRASGVYNRLIWNQLEAEDDELLSLYWNLA